MGRSEKRLEMHSENGTKRRETQGGKNVILVSTQKLSGGERLFDVG